MQEYSLNVCNVEKVIKCVVAVGLVPMHWSQSDLVRSPSYAFLAQANPNALASANCFASFSLTTLPTFMYPIPLAATSHPPPASAPGRLPAHAPPESR